MILNKSELAKIVNDLGNRKNIYTCEAQFQFDLADEIRAFLKKKTGGYIVYVEYPQVIGNRTVHYDIVIESINVDPHEYCVIELKYKTAAMQNASCYGQPCILKTHAAQSLGRYDFYKDIERIENYSSNTGRCLEIGYAILLTNDKCYWTKNGANRLYQAFSLQDGTTISQGVKSWPTNIRVSSIGSNRNKCINLKNTYNLNWEQWGTLANFKYLLVEVK